MSTSQTVVVGGPIPTGGGSVPVSDGIGGFQAQPLPSDFAHFSSSVPNDGGTSFLANANGAAAFGAPVSYPANKTTTKAILVVNMVSNDSSTSVDISLTKDGGVTPLGTINYLASETGIKPVATAAFAFPLTERADAYDLMVSFTAAGTGGLKLTATVELIP